MSLKVQRVWVPRTTVIFSQHYEDVAEKDLLGCLRYRFEDEPERRRRRTSDQTDQEQSDPIEPLPEISIVSNKNLSNADRPSQEWQANENRMARRYHCAQLPRSLRQGPSDCRINYDFLTR